MDAQVLLVPQEFQDCVRDGADAQLQGGAVLHQGGHVPADGLLHLADGSAAQFRQRCGRLHTIGQLGDVEEGLPHGAGHLVIDLGNDHLSVQTGGLGAAHGDAQGHIAVLVRRGDGNHRNVDGESTVREEPGGLVEEEGGVVRPPLLHSLAGGPAYEHGIMVEVPLHFGITVLSLSHGDPVDDLHVFVLFIVSHQRVHQDGGLIGRMAEKDPGAVGDLADSLISGRQLGSIERLPVFHLVYLLEISYIPSVICLAADFRRASTFRGNSTGYYSKNLANSKKQLASKPRGLAAVSGRRLGKSRGERRYLE